jgi:hypothetical protein
MRHLLRLLAVRTTVCSSLPCCARETPWFSHCDGHRAAAARQVEVARATGALAVLAVGVNVLSQVRAMAGDLDEAASLIVEAGAVTQRQVLTSRRTELSCTPL